MQTMQTMQTRRDAALKTAKDLVDGAKAEGRDLTDDEVYKVEGAMQEVDSLDSRMAQQKKSDDQIARIAGYTVSEDGEDDAPAEVRGKAGGTEYSKSVIARMGGAASGIGVKALLQGEVQSPPAATISPLPAVPTRLLDLVARERLDESHYSYLRQTVRDENAAVVPDNALKPTSIYTFEEIQDSAKVIAHLSDPFPLRYLEDHGQLGTVLDVEMKEGVLSALEAQILSGNGTGANFTGILQTSGVTDVPFATDAITTARTARTVLESKGERPTAWVLNPSDAAALELLRENGATGAFLMQGGVYDVLFGQGINRVTSNAVPQGTALLADWSVLRLRVRQAEHTIAATQSGDLFAKNQVQLRAEGRYGFEFQRPQAVAVVHLAE